MNISNYFIEKPKIPIIIFSLMVFLGIKTCLNLSLNVYPEINIPVISISTTYSGASAETVDRAVNSIIEESVQGLPHLLYTESSANNLGASSVSVTFDLGVDETRALVDVQNKVSQIESRLPDIVRKQGINIAVGNGGLLLTVNLISKDSSKDRIFLSDYAEKKIVQKLRSITGVSNVAIFGQMKRGVRIWVDPALMLKFDLDTQDIITSIQEQVSVSPVGRLGQQPTVDAISKETLIVSGYTPTNIEKFKSITLKSDDQSIVYLADVAKVELGSESYDETAKIDGLPTVMIGVFQKEKGNAVDISNAVREIMESESRSFPAGVGYLLKYDSSRYVDEASKEVVYTLLFTFVAVMLVVYSFIRSAYSTLIPCVVVPISLLGTIYILNLFGINLNFILLLGLIVATGIVVDDAILVVERVDYLKINEGLTFFNATIQAMKDITGPVISTSLILIIAFMPFCYMGGIQGILYKQFSLAIMLPIAISLIVALTLSPVMCSWSKNGHAPHKKDADLKVQHYIKLVSNYISAVFHQSTLYFLRFKWLVVVMAIISLGLSIRLYQSIPQSFVPPDDQGYVVIAVNLPDNSSLIDTTALMDEIAASANKDIAVESTITINGYNFIGGNGSNFGLAFAVLKDWSKRKGDDLTLEATTERLRTKINEKFGDKAKVFVFMPPTINGVGTVGGFDLKVYSYDEKTSLSELDQVANLFSKSMVDLAEVGESNVNTGASSPMYQLDIDTVKSNFLGIDIDRFNTVINALFGSLYIADLNLTDGNYRAIVQANDRYRLSTESMNHIHVKNKDGTLVPVSSFATMRMRDGASSVSRFNGRRVISISGSSAAGYSTAEAIKAVNAIKNKLPVGYDLSWAGQSALEAKSTDSGYILFCISILLIYFVLVVLYDMWILPFGILLGVPIISLGILLLIKALSIDLNTYTIIGLFLSIVLYVKTMVLIVDRAIRHTENSNEIVASIMLAMKERYRAIFMTSICLVAGTLPLIISAEPGHAARFCLGITLAGGIGMIVLVVLPLFPSLLSCFYTLEKKYLAIKSK